MYFLRDVQFSLYFDMLCKSMKLYVFLIYFVLNEYNKKMLHTKNNLPEMVNPTCNRAFVVVNEARMMQHGLITAPTNMKRRG